MYGAQREWKTFAATDGSYTEQVITHVGSGIEANAVDGDELQRRSFPDAGGGWQGAGYEYVRALGLAANAERVATEAVAAPVRAAAARRGAGRSSSTRRSCISRSTRAAATRRSSTGSSAPRRSYAGTSFLTTDKLDAGFRYGSDLVDIVADATAPGGMGTFGWDDEGVAAQAVPLVRAGHPHRLPDAAARRRRGSAAQSGGAMRADGWNRIPLIRMTNINLLPKPGMSFDEIVADTDDGPPARPQPELVDRRPAPELPVRDRAGLTRSRAASSAGCYRNATYTGITLRVLGSLRRGRRRVELRDARHAELRQGRAAADRPRRPRRSGARFRNVQVGVMK